MTVYSSANYAFQAPNGDDLITNGDDLLRALVDKLDLVIGGTPAVTSLPVAPVNGQHCCFLADSTNGVMWHLVWRSASRAGSGAWHYIGGPPLYAHVETDEATASAAYVALTTALSITTPAGITGDYDVSLGAAFYQVTAAADQQMSFAVGATVAADADAVFGNGSVTNITENGARLDVRKTAITTATALATRYKTAAATGHWFNRWLSVRPVQVW